MASSFQDDWSRVLGTPLLGKVEAMEEEVYTTRVMLGVLAEAESALSADLMPMGMVDSGEAPFRGEATWIKPDVPTVSQ